MALSMITIRTQLTGVTELNMHNIQLANPENRWTREIAKLTGKRKMSEDDRREKARLEFMGGLYINNGRVIVPQANVKRCLKEAAKAQRLGRNIDRTLIPGADAVLNGVPLEFPDSHVSPENLWDLGYYDTTIVASPGRVPRTRPQFKEWSLTAEWGLITTLLSFSDLRDIGEYAGTIEGLGDNRVNGAGRFHFTLTEVS